MTKTSTGRDEKSGKMPPYSIHKFQVNHNFAMNKRDRKKPNALLFSYMKCSDRRSRI